MSDEKNTKPAAPTPEGRPDGGKPEMVKPAGPPPEASPAGGAEATESLGASPGTSLGASPRADAGAGFEAAPEARAPKASHADDLIAQLRRDLSDYKDRNLRLMADMENLRRRTEDEKAGAAKYATTRFAGDIVNLVDNFKRATDAVPAGAAESDAALKSLIEGVTMTEREFLNVLERHGVKKIASIGEMFSPHFHQPMMQVPKPDVPAGTILQVLQEGYMIGDRVLRAAIVAVAEGGPKPGGKPSAAEPVPPAAGAGSEAGESKPGPGSDEPGAA